MEGWFLEGHIDHARRVRRLRIEPFPFLIGRKPGLPLSIDSGSVSRHHAEIFKQEGRLLLKDLNSTNGTFINHKPVRGEVALKRGDIIHIANIELRLTSEAGLEENEGIATQLGVGRLANKLPVGSLEIEEMFASKRICSVFQPIYNNVDETLFGFEILGRGTHPKLPKSPGKLLEMAEDANCAVELTELFRFDGAKGASDSGSSSKFFMNIHPRELDDPLRLMDSMQQVRTQFPHLHIVLEIHEKAVADLNGMKMLSTRLRALGIEIAYDDFGAGQTRLLELAEVPPDYLKFDIVLIKNINRAETRKEMLALLLELSKKMKIKTLAEGVSNQAESATCRALGFDLLQGFYYGRPITEIP